MNKISELTQKLFRQRPGSPDNKDKASALEPIEQPNDQSPDETKLCEYIKSKIDLVKQSNSRIAIEGIYLTNVAYLMGFDGVYYDTTYRQFKNIDPKRKITRNRFKINKILPTIQNRLARLTQSPPKYDVRPNSNSSEDKDSARLGLDIIENVFEKQYFDEKRQDLLMSAMQGGHSYIQVLWDPSLGKAMIDPESGEFIGFEGDVRLEVLNALEVFCDPLAKRIDDAQYLIKAKVRKLDYFKVRYPDRGEAVKEEQSWLLSSIYDLKSNSLTSVGIVGAQTSDQMRNSAIEIVYYEKRSREHPNGRMVVMANGILLEDKELPIGEFDIVKFDDIMIGGRYNSEAIITHLRPIQDQYNITRTRTANWVKAHLGGKYLVAKGSNLSQEALSNGDAEVVEYNPVPNAPPPSAMVIPTIPSYVYKDLETLDHEFDFVSGINEVSRGVLPSAQIPAAGMQFLQEQDQTRIGAQTQRNEIGYSKVGCAILKYVGKYYEMPRLLKLAGDGLGYTVKDFVGSDLQENYDVIVIAGSTAPSSKVLKRQDIMNVYQAGLLGNPGDPKLQQKLLKVMEFGDLSEVWKSLALDEQQVKKAISDIEEGKMPVLNEKDNHVVHLMEMNDYRKTDKYSNLEEIKKGLFEYVMEWHINAQVGLLNPGIRNQQMMAEEMVKQGQQGQQGQQQPMDPGQAGPAPEQQPPAQMQGA